MDEHQQHRRRPGEMNGIKPVLAGVLDDTRDAGEQARDTQPHHHAHDDADMRERLGAGGECLFGGYG
jgi:hypothetical protein